MASHDALQQQQQQSNCPPPFIPQNSHQQPTTQQNSSLQHQPQQLTSNNQPQLAFQSADNHQQLLALQFDAAQPMMSQQAAANQQLALQQAMQQHRSTNNSQLLACQRLTHSQAVRQRLNVIPALMPAEVISHSLAVQNSQRMALLLQNCAQASSAGRAMVPDGSPESAKLQLDNGHQMLSLQQGGYQLSELQKRILLHSNCQLSSERPRAPQTLNRPVKSDNSCMQLDLRQQMQQQLQQHQLLQQLQIRQQQQLSSCLYRTHEGVGTNQSVKEEVKTEPLHFQHENRDYKLVPSCVSDAESKCHDALQGQTVVSRNVEMPPPPSCKEESNSASKFTAQSLNFGAGGFRLSLPQPNSDAEQIIRSGSSTPSNRFPSQSVEQLSHHFAGRTQVVNTNSLQQNNSNPNAKNFNTSSSNFGFNVPSQGTVANEQNQIQPVSVPSSGVPITSGPHRINAYSVGKAPDGRNFNTNAQSADPANYALLQLAPKSVAVHQPNISDNEREKNTGDGSTKAGQNNGVPLNNFRPPTVVQQRSPRVAGSSNIAGTPRVDNAIRQRPVYYSSPVAVSRFPHPCPPGFILPVQQNSISSSAEPLNSSCAMSGNSPVTSANQCVSVASYQVSVQPEANQTSSGVNLECNHKSNQLNLDVIAWCLIGCASSSVALEVIGLDLWKKSRI